MRRNLMTQQNLAYPDLTIGERIKRVRGGRGFTCSDLAALIGRSRPYLSSIENGKNPPTPKIMRDIARILRVKEEQLNGKESLTLEMW